MSSYCDKISYALLTTSKADFSAMVDDLLAQLPAHETILRLVFFGRPVDNEMYLEQRSVLHKKVERFFGINRPSLSYVSQPPLNTPLLLEVHGYLPDKEDAVVYGKTGEYSYVIIENQEGKFLFAGGFQGDVTGSSIDEQSRAVFCCVEKLLRKEGFPVNSIVRQWNYIERITSFDDNDQHYQSFNNVRAAFYKQVEWPYGYPAATGIGANPGGVLVDFDAVLLKRIEDRIRPIDNRLQIAAHSYSTKVLKKSSDQKQTPKFERAKSLDITGKRLIYVSGTAAIRGEESLKDVGVGQQLAITLENINELTGRSRLLMLRVYLKHKDDFAICAELMRRKFPDLPVSYMWADVCRDELLIEIEGIAVI
ncbi:MAG: endoribonuclease L-PSP [Massilibacteroides sp.]|nr:endoribonuclease L-PSP [Massilibacteroides sp.]MDD3063392.1 endoribonuclease L-PSP [Massilibacteroides sp.]MDD4661153.1 endoribonuclease L-PSP [Massilibacteroides sp.]